MISRRQLALLAAPALLPATARAQDAWPSRPVTLVVPWAAGGSTDAVERILAQKLSSDTGRSFVVDNRTGANGTIGFNSVARARPDGYTMLVSTVSTYAMAPHLMPLPYDNEKDFIGIGLIASMPIIMVVNKNFPARTLAEFIAMAKRPNSNLTYANSGTGSSTHLATELFLQAAGLELADVGYRGGAPAVQDLLGGQVPLMVDTATETIEHHKAGRVRILAVTGEQRNTALPDVPTLKESGINVAADAFFGLYGPAGMPVDSVNRLNLAVGAVLREAAVQERIGSLGLVSSFSSPADLGATQLAHYRRWEAPIKASGLKPD